MKKETTAALIAHEELKDLLNYDPETGLFTWRFGRRKAAAGAVAGYLNELGYVRIRIFGKPYAAGRLAYFYMTGSWPANEIDHMNGDSSNNSWANLRDVTGEWNEQNKGPSSSRNATGFMGVTQHKNGFVASIKLGTFSTPEEAHDAYIRAKKMFHPGYAL